MFNKGLNKCPLHIAWPLAVLLAVPGIQAQQTSELQQVLERLDRLEEENHKLADEIHALRTELAASKGQSTQEQSIPAQTPAAGPEVPSLDERVQVAEQRISDLSQEKVEASQRFPISLTGLVLFNAFLNGKNSAGDEDPTTASATPGSTTNGATVAQTVLGLRYQSPQALWGAHVNGSIFFDFYGGTGTSLDQTARLRTAAIQLDWT
ncbi:MAG: hypothetical protein JOZ32_02725, partial [Bryobacterales bacterium]|nr:hypothetical protein [Bryobacterales bacterium]